MITNSLSLYRDSMWGYGSYIDKQTGQIWPIQGKFRCVPQFESNIPEDQRLMIPVYSNAHVRQKFMQYKAFPKSDMIAYTLINDKNFTLELDDSQDSTAMEYIHKVHVFCEDHQIETEYWDFYDKYTLPIARNWCEVNDVSYTND